MANVLPMTNILQVKRKITMALLQSTASTRYTNVAIALHWLIALLIIVNLAGGLLLDEISSRSLKFTVYQWHKSLGITVLLLSMIRLAWRLTHRPPPLPERTKAWEKFAARTLHWIFYTLMIGIPLAGWAIVSASTKGIPTVLFGVIPWPDLPMGWVENRQTFASSMGDLHGLLAYMLLFLLFLHIGAALRHHVYYRDEVLHNMLPTRRLKR